MKPHVLVSAGVRCLAVVAVAFLSSPAFSQGLTGNWAVRSANAVAPHPVYFDLHFDNGKLTGHSYSAAVPSHGVMLLRVEE
jgi:hypothetical protein